MQVVVLKKKKNFGCGIELAFQFLMHTLLTCGLFMLLKKNIIIIYHDILLIHSYLLSTQLADQVLLILIYDMLNLKDITYNFNYFLY